MANHAQLDKSIKQARRKTGLDTDAAIIANDGQSVYGSIPGYLRVQVRQGGGYLKPMQVANHTGFNPTAGTSVRLGWRHNVYGIVDIDAEAIRASGGNPDVVRLPDENSEVVNQGNIPVFKVVPQSPPSTNLVALPIWIERPDGLTLFMPEAAIDLSTAIGNLSSGEHQLVGVFLKPDNTIETTLSTAKSHLDPMTTADIAECYAARTPGSVLGSFWVIADGITEINSDREFLDARQFINLPPVVYSTADVSNPPTDAELDSAFGEPADVGVLTVILNDAGANTNLYMVVSDGTSWWHTAMTKAT